MVDNLNNRQISGTTFTLNQKKLRSLTCSAFYRVFNLIQNAFDTITIAAHRLHFMKYSRLVGFFFTSISRYWARIFEFLLFLLQAKQMVFTVLIFFFPLLSAFLWAYWAHETHLIGRENGKRGQIKKICNLLDRNINLFGIFSVSRVCVLVLKDGNIPIKTQFRCNQLAVWIPILFIYVYWIPIERREREREQNL